MHNIVCAALIGRIVGLARPFVTYRLRINSKTKRRRRSQNWCDRTPRQDLPIVPIFSSNGQRSMSPEVKNLKKMWR